MRPTSLKPLFVEFVPEALDDGMLYIAMGHRTVVHKCCCGCGSEVVTPLDPTQWKLIYDGRVTLHPSVGSWNLPCRSHYWIQENTVRWAPRWTDVQIAAARTSQRHSTARYYAGNGTKPEIGASPTVEPTDSGFWAKVWKWIIG
jgi:hypothetical protein